MKTNRNIVIAIVVGVLLLGGLFYWFFGQDKRHNWQETYESDSKEPYGTYAIFELLKDFHPGYEFYTIDSSLGRSLDLSTINCPSNYIFIGNQPYYNTTSANDLLQFVAHGNNAFISSQDISYLLHDTLRFDGCSTWDGYKYVRDTVVTMELFETEGYDLKEYKYQFIQYFDTTGYFWDYYSAKYACLMEPGLVRLGDFNDGYTNFFRVRYGQGYFYFHTTPLVFSNYYMSQEQALEYPQELLSYLPAGDIYWDELSKDPLQGEEPEYRPSHESMTPLQFILKQDSLRWAWYLLIAGLILYILFHSKRRQKAIPVIEPYENTSMEFVHTMGDLYFLQNDHKKLAVQKMKLFKTHIRTRYHISTQQSDEEIVKRVTQKAEIDKRIIERIFNKFRVIDSRPGITLDDLIEFNNLIDHFFKIAK